MTEPPHIVGINKVHNQDWMTNALPDKCANLIIADPPYFQVKGDFDFIWPSFDAYLEDVERWAVECKRILADNGTLFWWGMDRKIAYAQVILDKYFSLLSTLVWEKPSIPNEWDTRRTFPERGQERLLMYSNEYDPTGLEVILEEHIKPRHPFANYLKSEFERAGKPIAEVRKWVVSELGFDSAMINRWLEGSSIMKPEIYERFRAYLNQQPGKYLRQEYEDLRQEYEDLRQEYEDLRQEYEDLRRPFNNYLGLTDILRFSNSKPNGHPTKKPEKLTRALILTCSRPGDLLVVPFAGSGTECAMAAKEGRRFIGYDVEKKYVDMANKRAAQHLAVKLLFA